MQTVAGRVLMVAFAPGEAGRRVSLRHDGEAYTVYLTPDVPVTADGSDVDLVRLAAYLADHRCRVTLTRDPARYGAVVRAEFQTEGVTS